MKRVLISICMLVVSQMVFAIPQTIQYEEIGFTINLPDGWVVDQTKYDDAILLADKPDYGIVRVSVYISPEGKYWNIGQSIKSTREGVGDNLVSIDYPPFYNLLRHSFWYSMEISGIRKKELQLFRGQERVSVQVILYQKDSLDDDCNAILNSAKIDYTTRDYFKQAKINIGSWLGCMFLTLYPLLGFYTGYFRKKWRWYRGDKTSKWSFFGCLLGSMLLFAAVVVMLKDCMTLMGCVVGVMLLFWIGFFLDNKFFAGMYKGLFGA